MKQLKRIPKIKNRDVLIELTRAHFMIGMLSFACIGLLYSGDMAEIYNESIVSVLIALLLIVGVFSFFVSYASFKRIPKK